MNANRISLFLAALMAGLGSACADDFSSPPAPVLSAPGLSNGQRVMLRAGLKKLQILEEKFERAEFRRESVRVEPRKGDRSLVEVSGQGRSINVGRFVRPELRPVLAKEIRMALRGA